MGYIVRMPKLGMEMQEGTLLEWRVEAGDSVAEGDVIAEIESEKTTAEVEAREAGTLRRVFLEPGESVPPGGPIGIVADPDAEIDSLLEEAAVDGESDPDTAPPSGDEPSADTAEQPAPTQPPTTDGEAADEEATVRASPRAERRAAELDVDLTAVEGTGPNGAITADDVEVAAEHEPARASPRAERRAEELGVDLASVSGSGPGGAITADDVEAAATGPAAPDDDGPASLTVASERPLDGMRRTIATRLGESYREAVHVTEHRKADAEALFAATDAAEDALGVDVSLPDVLLVAISAALTEHPAFNARFEDDVHRLYEEHNIGMAVDIDAGLIAPVIPDVGEKSLATIASDRRAITGRALEGDYTMDDLANGTFTVTNLGVLGVESFDPVINPPQIAILGVNAVTDLAVQGADGDVEFRRHLPLDLSFDHRIVDGADAARFLDTLVGHIEDPWPLLPEEIPRVDTAEDGATEMPGRSVSAALTAGLRGRVAAGSFEVPFDEPESVGGSGSAPTPVDLFLASLAACMVESIRYQAVEKLDLELSDLRVDASADPDSGPVESIAVDVHLDVDADPETVERLVELGKRGCHVSQLVDPEIPFELDWIELR